MDQETEEKTIQELPPLPTCPCGHDRHHYLVQAKGEYTAWGHFLVAFGISYKPIKVKYHCMKCSSDFDETTDPDVLNSFY